MANVPELVSDRSKRIVVTLWRLGLLLMCHPACSFDTLTASYGLYYMWMQSFFGMQYTIYYIHFLMSSSDDNIAFIERL